MLITLLILFWAVGGVYCIILDWTESFDVKGNDIIPLLIGGVVIGPIIGLLDCLSELFKILTGKYWNKVFIERRTK